MSDTTKLSEAKRALLEKYLKGELQLPKTATNSANPYHKAEETGSAEGVIPVQTSGSRRPFFYLHGDWRDKAFYCYPLARALGTDQPFYILEPRDLINQPLPATFEEMAATHLKSMRAIQPEGPYSLGGWCNGGLIAYEMALQLHAQGQKVDLLVLMDAVGPHPTHRRLLRSVICALGNLLRLDEDKRLYLFLLITHTYRYMRFSRYRLEFPDNIQPKGSEHVKTTTQEKIEDSNNKLHSVLSKLSALFPPLALLRQNWNWPSVYEWLAHGYVSGNLYPGKITFFWDSEDTWRPVWWRKVVAAKADQVEVHVLPGTQYSLRQEALPLLAEHLRDCLERAQIATDRE